MNSENKLDNKLSLKVLQELPYGIIVSDADSNLVFWNEKAKGIMQVTETAIAQQDWAHKYGVFNLDKTTMYKTEDLPMSKALLGQYVEGEKLYIKTETMTDGVYIKVTAVPLFEQGKIHAAVVTFEDITKEQKFYENFVETIDELKSYLKEISDTKTIYSYEKLSKAALG